MTPTTKPTPTPVVKVTPIIRSDKASQTVTHGTATTTTFTVTAGRQAGRRPGRPDLHGGEQQLDVPVHHHGHLGGRHGDRAEDRHRHLQDQARGARDRDSTAAASDTYTYTVRAAATLAKNGSTALLARVTGVAGQTVQVQRLDGQKWIAVATYRAVATCTINGVRSGTTYRVVVPDTATIVGVTSNSLRA